MTVKFLLKLFAGENCLFSVDNDNMVSAIDMRSKLGLTLTAKKVSNLSSGTAKRFSCSVNYIPLLWQNPLKFSVSGM